MGIDFVHAHQRLAHIVQRTLAMGLQTHSKRSLDDVSQALMRMEKVYTASFIQLSESVLGGASEVLDSPLLR